jgi:protein-S-isoprenylcysteine O-methyltransferase Ste14
MKSSEVKSILILPFNVLITIPFLITLFSKNDYPIFVESYSLISVLVGVLMGIIGLILVGWTISDFSKLGKGSLAPWNPTKNLVVIGIYQHVRNPMITGVIIILLSESVLFYSFPIFIWAILFFLLNAIYIPSSEEKGLVSRFGEEYLEYKKNVPRWIPRISAWKIDKI